MTHAVPGMRPVLVPVRDPQVVVQDIGGVLSSPFGDADGIRWLLQQGPDVPVTAPPGTRRIDSTAGGAPSAVE